MEDTILYLLDDIELYNFECEGGPLVNCVEWIELKRIINDLLGE